MCELTNGLLAEALLETFRHELPENTYDNRELEKAFVELARPMYQSKVLSPGPLNAKTFQGFRGFKS